MFDSNYKRPFETPWICKTNDNIESICGVAEIYIYNIMDAFFYVKEHTSKLRALLKRTNQDIEKHSPWN